METSDKQRLKGFSFSTANKESCSGQQLISGKFPKPQEDLIVTQKSFICGFTFELPMKQEQMKSQILTLMLEIMKGVIM